MNMLARRLVVTLVSFMFRLTVGFLFCNRMFKVEKVRFRVWR